MEELAKIGDKDPTAVREKWWPILRCHAEECRRRMIVDELRKPADKHVWQGLHRVAERGSLGRGFPNAGTVGSDDDITLSALRHGALCEGLGDDLEQLSPDELRVAARSALAPDSMIRDGLGRPGRGPVLDYAKALAEIHKRIAKKPPGYSTKQQLTAHGGYFERRGPSVRFYRAGLAPIAPSMKHQSIVDLIRLTRTE